MWRPRIDFRERDTNRESRREGERGLGTCELHYDYVYWVKLQSATSFYRPTMLCECVLCVCELLIYKFCMFKNIPDVRIVWNGGSAEVAEAGALLLIKPTPKTRRFFVCFFGQMEFLFIKLSVRECVGLCGEGHMIINNKIPCCDCDYKMSFSFWFQLSVSFSIM